MTESLAVPYTNIKDYKIIIVKLFIILVWIKYLLYLNW